MTGEQWLIDRDGTAHLTVGNVAAHTVTEARTLCWQDLEVRVLDPAASLPPRVRRCRTCLAELAALEPEPAA